MYCVYISTEYMLYEEALENLEEAQEEFAMAKQLLRGSKRRKRMNGYRF